MIFHLDYYGIDTPDPEHLLANQHPYLLESMCRFIGADSLAFLSIDGLYEAVAPSEAQPAQPAVHRPPYSPATTPPTSPTSPAAARTPPRRCR